MLSADATPSVLSPSVIKTSARLSAATPLDSHQPDGQRDRTGVVIVDPEDESPVVKDVRILLHVSCPLSTFRADHLLEECWSIGAVLHSEGDTLPDLVDSSPRNVPDGIRSDLKSSTDTS